MKIIDRKDITSEIYKEMFEKEAHHNHEIIEYDNGDYTWKPNPDRGEISFEMINYYKNNDLEAWKRLCRDAGFSLYGYWYEFYQHKNNKLIDNKPIDFPTNIEIWKWWETQKFQKEQGDQEYTMIFEIDLPKILKAFSEHFNNKHE